MSAREILGESPLFSHFDADDLDALAASVRTREFAGGAEFDLGGGAACFIVAGGVILRRATPYGPFVVRKVGAGELLGEPALLKLAASAAETVIDGSLRALVFDGARLEELGAASPRFRLNLLWTLWKSLSAKLRRANERLTGFFTTADAVAAAAPPARDPADEAFRVDLNAKRGLFAEQRLSGLEINFLSTLSREERYAGGEAIFHEGDVGDAMYVVLDGKIRISKRIPGVGEEALSFLERGAYFGEMSLIDRQPRSASAVAHGGQAIVLAISRDVLGGLLDIGKVSSPRLLGLLCEIVARRLSELDDKLVGWHVLSAGAQPEAPG